jgi:N-ethylmaleimide reductase
MKRSYETRTARALFEPTQAGALKLANRIVMAPLTRNRAGPGLVPGPFAVEYYAQRATVDGGPDPRLFGGGERFGQRSGLSR